MGKIILTGKRVLVTGGKGYLGGFLTNELLNRGAEVFVLSNDVKTAGNDFYADITRFDEVNEAIGIIQPEIVYHLAANLRRDRDFSSFPEVAAVNVTGTLNLLLALQNTACQQFIFTSTSEVYGNHNSPFTEEQLPDPVSPYSVSKLNAEMLIRAFCDLHQMNYTILRVFNFYGRNMPVQFFIPQIIDSLKNNRDFLMTKGEQIRDFLYVDDVVEALMISLGNPNAYNQTFNVCSGKGIKLIELAENIALSLNSGAKIIPGAIPYRENEIWEMIGDHSKIKNLLGFQPETGIIEGLKSIIED